MTDLVEKTRDPGATALYGLPEGTLTRLGFRFTLSGAHSSRTMMLGDVSRLFAAAPPEADAATLRQLVVARNLLQRPSERARRLTYFHLTRLYGLDPEILLYRLFRQLWETDEVARPVLALTLVMARDPILRLSRDFMQGLEVGAAITREDTEQALKALTGDRFRPTSLRSYAQNINGTWTQAGFLAGHRVKRRRRPEVTPANLAFNLYLGHLEGDDGAALFSSPWAQLLDVPSERRFELARAATQRGLLVLKMAGDVVDVRFPNFPSREELMARER